MAKGSRFPLCKDDGGTRDAESRNVPTHYLTKARGQTSRRKGNWRAVCSDKLHARFGGGQGEKAVLRTSLAAYPTQWALTSSKSSAISLYTPPVRAPSAPCLCYVRQLAIPPPIMRDNPCYQRQSHLLPLSGGGILGAM